MSRDSRSAGSLAPEPVIPQNVVRPQMLADMFARVTKRTELGAMRTLPTARRVRVERGIRVRPA
jgi:hypothetical protein